MSSTNLKDYLGVGNKADRPATLSLSPSTVGIYYAQDTDEVSFWKGSWGPWRGNASVGGATRQSITTTATLTVAATDEYCEVKALAGDLAITTTGTRTGGDALAIVLTAVTAARALSWDAAKFLGSGGTLPTTLAAGKTMILACVYVEATGKYHVSLPASVTA